MVVQFICLGNTNRSRIAEAYLKSKQLPHFSVLSSGLYAHMNLSGPIYTYTRDLLKNHGLLNYTAPSWQQLTQGLINKSDVIVCMRDDVYQGVVSEFDLNGKTVHAWHIDDVQHRSEQEIVQYCELTLSRIAAQVDELLLGLGYSSAPGMRRSALNV